MKTKIERQIFEKMKVKDFGESMCNETKRQVFNWVLQQLRKHGVMQAGSDGAKEAAVGNSAAGQSGRAVKVKTGTIVFCEGEQFVFGINRKTGKPECFNLYGMSGISDEGALH